MKTLELITIYYQGGLFARAEDEESIHMESVSQRGGKQNNWDEIGLDTKSSRNYRYSNHYLLKNYYNRQNESLKNPSQNFLCLEMEKNLCRIKVI